MKTYWEENRENMRCYKAEYNKNNREIINRKCHDYYEENRIKVLSQMKEHRSKHKETINEKRRNDYPKYANRQKEYVSKNRKTISKKANVYCLNKKKNDPGYQVLCNLRSRISSALKKATKYGGTVDLIGCTIPELRKHLSKQFKPGMTWENYGEWHVDHITPCACFDLSYPNQQKECFNYRNLRPMWAVDNMRKGARLERPFQPFLPMAL